MVATKFVVPICLALVALAWPAPQGFSSSDPLPLWRKVGRDGNQCVSCHTPSGREIVMGSFDSADITRRAYRHLSNTDSLELGREIVALRGSAPVDSSTPLAAPGGLLPGATVIDKDWAFAKSYQAIGCSLGEGQIKDVASARVALRRLCVMPLSQVRTGLDINPLSRDPFRPLDGMALADWIPDVGLPPKGVDALLKWSKEDGQNLDALESALFKACGPSRTTFEELARDKRLALLELEIAAAKHEPLKPLELKGNLAEDPIWAVGNFARLVGQIDSDQLGMTLDQVAIAGVPRNVSLDFKPMALAWMWSSWTTDPTLAHISRDPKAVNGTYLAQAFWVAGPYDFHAAYFAARRPAEVYFANSEKQALQPEIGSFVNDGALNRFGPPPGLRRITFKAVCADMYRMDSLVMLDDLAQGKKLANPVAANQQLNNLFTYAFGPEATATDKDLRDRVKSTLQPLIQIQIHGKAPLNG